MQAQSNNKFGLRVVIFMASLRFAPPVWFSLVCALGIVAVAVTLFYNQRPCGIDKNGFAAISDGMTRDEVESILGRPPGDYTTKKEMYFRFPPGSANAALYLGWTWEEWISDHGWITLTFDRDGKVIQKDFRGVYDLPDRPFLERIERFARQLFGRM